jgi:hypothetical protein
MQPRNDDRTRRGRNCNVYRRLFVLTPSPNTARKFELTVRQQLALRVPSAHGRMTRSALHVSPVLSVA